MKRARFIRNTISTGTALAAALSGAPIAAAGPKALAKLTKVSVRFNWTMKGEFTPFVVAREKGFYKALNIEPELAPGKSGTQAAQVVGTGNDHFGYIPSIQVIEAVNHQIPLRAVATCGRYTGMCWASRSDIPLTGPKSLEGRRVSISASSTFFQIWDAFAKKYKIDQSKVDVVSADPAARIGLFLNRQVDIMADIFIANDFVILESRVKEKLNLYRLAQANFDPLGYLLVANAPLIDKEPALVEDFTNATLQGLRYMHDHPDEAARLMTDAYGDQLGAAVIKGQVDQFVRLINDRPIVGKNDPNEWTRSLDLLSTAGIIDHKLEHAQYYTNAFV